MRSEAWRPAAAARNRSPREARDPALQALRPGCEELAARIRKAPARRCRTAGAQGDGSAAPGAQHRHGGAPRGERPASWDARRLARRLACRVMACRTGVPLSTRTFLGAPPTPRFGLAKQRCKPRAQNAPRERWRLFDMVNCASTRCSSSSFETHRSALGLWKRLRSSGCDAPQHEGRVRRASLTERSQASTNLRLYEIAAGAVPLFPDCY